jgi:competence protein ComEC
MKRNSWTILCLAYVIGLLSTAALDSNPNPSWQQCLMLVLGLGFFSAGTAVWVPRFWRRGPRAGLWLSAGLIAVLATVYLQIRLPQPQNNDISRLLEINKTFSQVVTVEGTVLTQGKLTGDRRIQFWFAAEKLQPSDRPVTGKLYVTVPEQEIDNLYASQRLTITGKLYKPRSPSNPGSFDFKAYLASQGAFAGLKGQNVIGKQSGKITFKFLWQAQQRIIEAQVRWLGNREGTLVSSMVIGQRVVDLSDGVRDSFVKVGLAHVLAASGFQVSLLLGAAIALTARFSPKVQFLVALSSLLFYVSLTGIQPSVMRAAVMGVGGAIALISDRKMRQLGSLLLSGTILLLFNPLWIWDLGFQLSFLATFGLIVTMPALEKRLQWLPPTVATLIALPLAASLWTFPLLIHVFSVVAIYSIPANILAAPLVTAISLGGMASALVALIYPLAGSAIASLLYYPTYLLVELVQFFEKLPGSSLAVGKLSLSLMLFIYALIGLVWLNRWCQKRWWAIAIAIVVLIIVPIRYERLNLTRVTVLATRQEPVIVIQNRGKVTLINSGDRATAKYTVLPFLDRQGINQLDCAVAFASGSELFDGWMLLKENLTIKRFWSNKSFWEEGNKPFLLTQKAIEVDSLKIHPLGKPLSALLLQIQDQSWLIVLKNQTNNLDRLVLPKKISVLLWSGKSLKPDWLERVKPQVSIAVASSVSPKLRQQLQQDKIQLYWTGRDGAIQWNGDRNGASQSKRGFYKASDRIDQDLVF